MTDERLQELYARALRGRAADARGDAAADADDVAPETLLALARGELPEEERLALFDRVMASERSRQEFALVRAATEADAAATRASGQADESGDAPDGAGVVPLRLVSSVPRPPRAPAGRGWWRSGVPVAVAATLLLAVGITRWGGRAVEPVLRGAIDTVALAAPADGAELATPIDFAWHPVDGAVRYEFQLLDTDPTPIFSTVVADTTMVLPASVTLRPGVIYRWLVRAIDDAGQPRGTGTRRLRVRGG